MLANIKDQFNTLPTWAKVSTGIAAVALPAALFYLRGSKKRRDVLKKDWKKDVVYLYQYPRAVIPSISPFCLKLETWLRAADITYENVDCGFFTRSKEGMMPFVELNGKEYCDSSFTIRDLTKIFDKNDMFLGLSQADVGMGRAIEQMIENSTLMSYAYVRYGELAQELFSEKVLGIKLPFYFPLVMPMWRIKKTVLANLKAHGIGRHERSEVINIGIEDLRALSVILGEKKFILGDKVTRVDATVFGTLAQILYLPLDTPHKRFIESECKNLVDYCQRIKHSYWPDWNEIQRTKSLTTSHK